MRVFPVRFFPFFIFDRRSPEDFGVDFGKFGEFFAMPLYEEAASGSPFPLGMMDSVALVQLECYW